MDAKTCASVSPLVILQFYTLAIVSQRRPIEIKR